MVAHRLGRSEDVGLADLGVRVLAYDRKQCLVRSHSANEQNGAHVDELALCRVRPQTE
jgi:hypothetical protein